MAGDFLSLLGHILTSLEQRNIWQRNASGIKLCCIELCTEQHATPAKRLLWIFYNPYGVCLQPLGRGFSVVTLAEICQSFLMLKQI